MRAKPTAITSLPPSPDAERHSRMIRYGIAMGIRVICIFLCLIVPGWWMLIPAAGAILLPYFAVVLANSARTGPAVQVVRPGAVVHVDRHDEDSA